MPQRRHNSQSQPALRPGSACLALLGLLSLGTVGAQTDTALDLLSHAGFAQAGAGLTHEGGPVPVGESKLAQAQAEPASDAALCALPDELLQVTVGGQTRGDFLVKVTPAGVVLEKQALQASEIRYGRQTVTCDGVAYLLLTPEVKPNYDPAGQTLSLTPVLDLLPGNTLDFRGARALTPVPTQPAYGADGGLRVNASSGGTVSAQTYVGGAYFGGALSGYVGVSASASSSASGSNTAGTGRTTTGSFGVRAVVHYDISTDWGVSAAYRVDAATVGGLGYGVGSFSGVSVNTRGGLQRELAKVELDLPLEANVVVRVGERTLRSFRAAPGKLVLLNIPLENVVGTVEVNVSDSTGTRSFSSPYSFGGGTLQPGGYVAAARAGYLGDPFSGTAQRTADVNFRVGLPRNWSLQGAARLLEGEYGASVQARHSGAAEALGLGATVSGSLTPDNTGTSGNTGTRLIPDVRLNADYSRQIGNLGLSATVTVPLLKPAAAQVGAALGYQAGRWSSSLSGGYDLGARTLNASLGAGYTFDDQRQLTAGITGGYNLQDKLWNAGLNASYTASNRQQYNAYVTGAPGRVTVGIGLRYTPDDKLAIDAGANVSAPVGTPSASTPGIPAPDPTRYGGTLAASYLLAPNQTVRASTDFRSLNASYEDSRRVYASAGVSLTRTQTATGTEAGTTSGIAASGSAEVRGAVTFLGGKAVLGQGLGQRAVVVRTGTPGIPLLLNGSRVAVTGADGEALLTGLPEGSISQVAVDLDALPFNITARDASADVSLAQSGVYVLDWTHNFDVSRWVQLFWGPAEHSVYGVFEVGGQKYTLDDQGYVLIPETRGAQRGTLSADDGSRSCQLDIPATGEKAVCPVQPVQDNVGTAPKAVPTALPEVAAQPPLPGPDEVQKP